MRTKFDSTLFVVVYLSFVTCDMITVLSWSGDEGKRTTENTEDTERFDGAVVIYAQLLLLVFS